MKTPVICASAASLWHAMATGRTDSKSIPFTTLLWYREYLVPPFLSLMSSRQPLPQTPEIEQEGFIDRLILNLYIFSLRNPKLSSARWILSAPRNWYCCVLREIREKNHVLPPPFVIFLVQCYWIETLCLKFWDKKIALLRQLQQLPDHVLRVATITNVYSKIQNF